jgi:hypothetical protein
MLSGASKAEKKIRLLECLKGGATLADVEGFLKRRRSLPELLVFITAYDTGRASLPLHIANHIRHLVHNPFINAHRCENSCENGFVLSCECLSELCAFHSHLPSEMAYVLRRVKDDYALYSGWVLKSRADATVLEETYQRNATEQFWSSAIVIAVKYEGMGHFSVLGFSVVDDAFFVFPEGGSNGWDREDNFMKSIRLTSDTIRKVSWKILMKDEVRGQRS